MVKAAGVTEIWEKMSGIIAASDALKE